MQLRMGKSPIQASYRLSKSGITALKARLDELRQARQENIERLRLLREQQSDSVTIEDSSTIQTLSTIQFLDSEITSALHVLANSKVIRSSRRKARAVRLGSRVLLRSGKRQIEYTIVSSIEADPLNGKISDESPIGRELIGKKALDRVSIAGTSGRHPTEFQVISFN